MKYKTINKSVAVKQNINKSIFIGSVFEATSISEAKVFLNKTKELYKDANHNAFAYRIGIDKEEFFYSDDGEPPNTAGLPIYNSIRSFGVTNVLVVVTRYFGGVKLGIPGLIKAYGSTARFALESSGIIEKETYKIFEIRFSYPEIQLIKYLIEKYRVQILKKDFSDNIVFSLKIEEDNFDSFKENLLSKTDKVEFL